MQRTVDHLHLVLMGKTGSGVSASANTILGQKVFPSDIRLTSVTDRCLKHTAEVLDRRVSVMDTPNFFTSNDTDLRAELRRGLEMCSAGVHALILVFSLNTFTQQDADTVFLFKQMFGKNLMKHTLILFTHGDELQNKSLDQLIRENTNLTKLTEEFGGRFHLLNNRDMKNRDQVCKLLMKIDRMVSENENSSYTLQMFEKQSFKFLLLRFTKPKYLCAVSVVFVLALGYVNMRNEGSFDFKTFLYGCTSGAFSAVAGAAPAAIGTHVFDNHRWRTSVFTEMQPNHFKLLEIMTGFAVGMISGYFVGPAGSTATLFRGILGGFGVPLFWSCNIM